MARRNKAEIELTARDRTKSAFRAVNQNLGKFAAIGIAGAAAGVALLTRAGLQQIDVLAKQAKLLGITTEKLAAFKLVAQKTGIEEKTLEKSLINVTRVVAEAAEGTGLATDTLKKLGLEAKALSQQSPDEQFLQIAEAMKGLNSQSEKVLASYELFGGRGAALLRTLEAGSAGFEEAEEKTKRFGTAISAVDAASVEEANDAFTDLQESIKGVGFDLARRFAPGMKSANEQAAGFIVTIRRDFIPAMALLFEQLGVLQNNVRGLTDIELAVRVEVQADTIAQLEKDVVAAQEKVDRARRLAAASGDAEFNQQVNANRQKQQLIQLEEEKVAAEERLTQVMDEQQRRANIIIEADKRLADQRKAQEEEARTTRLEAEGVAEAELFNLRIEAEEERATRIQALRDKLSRSAAQAAVDEAKAWQRSRDAQVKIEERAAFQTIRLRQMTAATSVRILQVLVGKNKTVARALFLVEKGLAIARTVQNTAAASVKALAELGPIAGPPAAAAIQAYGAAQIGLIAATALAGVGGIGGGGDASGIAAAGFSTSGDLGGGGDGSFDAAPSSGGSGVQEQGVVQLIFPNVFGITPDVVDALADALREASENRDVIVVSGTGRNAEILGGVNS